MKGLFTLIVGSALMPVAVLIACGAFVLGAYLFVQAPGPMIALFLLLVYVGGKS